MVPIQRNEFEIVASKLVPLYLDGLKVCFYEECGT